MRCYLLVLVLFLSGNGLLSQAFVATKKSLDDSRCWRSCSTSSHSPLLAASSDNVEESSIDTNRRNLWFQVTSVVTMGLLGKTMPASARSRTQGYAVQKTEQEWQATLSPMQYEILRKGVDERPGFSVLEAEFRPGVYACAGCGTPLFVSGEKFVSGTGFGSFAASLPGVEVDHHLNALQESLSLSGSELRCGTCGGHIGDVYKDGFLFVGTNAAATGLRFSVDGAALIFYPATGDALVRGDTPEPPGTKTQVPEWLESPLVHKHHLQEQRQEQHQQQQAMAP